MKRIYLDHASATPVDPTVLEAMGPFWSLESANPSAIHKEGVHARNAVDSSRKTIAGHFGVLPDEIIFTGSATESVNLALRGSIIAWKTAHKGETPHIIVSEIEHDAVLELAHVLELEGVRVTRLPVDGDGIVSLDTLYGAITNETVLVSVMYANNEIGTIQPIAEIAKNIRKWKKEVRGVARDHKSEGDDRYPLFHTDATQAVNYLPIHIPALGVDLFTANAAKIYGPKGIGMLYVARDVSIAPIIRGGGHEKGLRAGTENVPAIVGFAHALTLARELVEGESKRLSAIRDHCISQLEQKLPGVIINGSKTERLPNNVNFSLPSVDHEYLALALDARGFAVSTKSACNEMDAETSHVLVAIRDGGTPGPTSGIRLSFGRQTTKEDIDLFVETIGDIRKTMLVV